ncbi:MAG: energy-coupling factor transporter transmembrane protein EcfT [Lachnospiraceae bacterium]|nr:energy-coupling factor transporter transmembrane protein EcfT [Lachnospiraceae bacterium]
MFRDITLGQYYPTESVIHSLDPRVKLFSAFIFIISLFLFDDVPGFIFISVCMAGFIALSRVPVSFMLRGLRAIVMLLMIAALFNMFLTPGRKLFSVWVFTVTDVGLKNAVLMSIRMIYLIVGTSVMTLTTTPNALTNGLEKSMNPFSKIGVPVHEIAMMMSIALRFIPILIEETDKIMKAQMARGADFETGGLIKRAKAMVPLLVPLFVSAFRRAGDLALAMEARCYNGGEGRTKMKPLTYARRDRIAYAAVLLYLAVLIVWRVVRRGLAGPGFPVFVHL